MRRIAWGLGAFLGFLALVSCAGTPPPEAPTPTPLPTAIKPTFVVERGDIIIKTTLGGRVIPVTSKTVQFALDGVIGNVYVQEGDYVEQGQLLADLQSIKELEQQWAEASAAAKYEETVSTNVTRRAEIGLQIAELNLQDLVALNATESRLGIARLQVELAQMDVDEIRANPALHAFAAKAKELEAGLADAQLKAPVAGYIVVASTPGQSVKTTTPAFEISDLSALEIGASAMDEELKQLSEGMPLMAYLEGQPEKLYPGVIRQLPYPYGAGTQGNNGVRVTLQVPEGDPIVKLGARVVLTLVLDQKANVLWLSPQAIRSVGGRTFVVTQSTLGQQRVDVTLGLQTRDRVEIVGGLSESQIVIGP